MRGLDQRAVVLGNLFHRAVDSPILVHLRIGPQPRLRHQAAEPPGRPRDHQARRLDGPIDVAGHPKPGRLESAEFR